MNRRVVLWAAGVIYVVAWFLPVLKYQSEWASGSILGWEAFLFALRAILPDEGITFEHWWVAPLYTLSAVSNLAMIWALLILPKYSGGARRALAWTATVAFVINGHWLLTTLIDDERDYLMLGYYLWWGSFLLVALAVRGQGGSSTKESRAP